MYKVPGTLQLYECEDIRVSRLLIGEIIPARTKAIALNPADRQGVEEASALDSIADCDYDLVIHLWGGNTSRFKVGERTDAILRSMCCSLISAELTII
jgi:hypothetical protein